jgi:parvulin-like peptidyl-prolyl isomerase
MTLIVNGEKIEDALIQQEAERMRPGYEEAFKDMDPKKREAQLLDWSKENVIERTLIRQEAKTNGGKIPEEQVQTALDGLKSQYADEEQFYKDFDGQDDEKIKQDLELQMRIERTLQLACEDIPEPPKDEILKFYEQNKEQFKSPEQIRVSHIVKHIDWQTDETAALGAIKNAQDELQKGVLFEAVAQQFSDCPENGGDLGYITREQMVEEFEDVVFNLGIGQTSDIFRTRYGFHIAKLYDRKPPVVEPLDKVKKNIAEQLKDQMQQKAIEEFIDRLRNKAKIKET